MDKDIERYHYLNSPFVARFVRFHPIGWQHQISMRAGLIGCPYKGKSIQSEAIFIVSNVVTEADLEHFGYIGAGGVLKGHSYKYFRGPPSHTTP